MGFFQNLVVKKLVQSKMKNVPREQQEQFMAMIEKNPDFFQKIAGEIQEKIKQGKDQMGATMEVMQKHQTELQEIMKK